MQPVVLDTDVASLTHKGRLASPLATRLIGRKPLITFVTFGELTQWTEIRDWGNLRRQELADWLSGIPVLPGDDAVAATGRARLTAVRRTDEHTHRNPSPHAATPLFAPLSG